ncbi:hypothetical protein [Halococcus sp. PRR34]|jgi:hypothetical protein|uniref:hypothetical protein n=1 Tax=Halococcus sp. PRR34 TaxID=3020830 RepID=UPI002360E2C0|nr:hypothetical protein [Halococcus sp. PRR34]
MTSDKETVHADLVEASTSVIDQLFEDTRVVEIGQDNWYPDLLFRQDTPIVHETADDATIQVPTKAEADIRGTGGSEERYFKHISGARSRLEDGLNARDFVTEAYTDPDRGQGRLRVYGWNRDPLWFQHGDYMKVYRWRTPIEVVHVCPAGEQPPENRPLPVTGDGTYIGADSHHLYLRGNRGGEYLIDYDDDVGSLYQRNTQMNETLEKMVEVSRTIFVGNPKTGPRLDISSDGTEE